MVDGACSALGHIPRSRNQLIRISRTVTAVAYFVHDVGGVAGDKLFRAGARRRRPQKEPAGDEPFGTVRRFEVQCRGAAVLPKCQKDKVR